MVISPLGPIVKPLANARRSWRQIGSYQNLLIGIDTIIFCNNWGPGRQNEFYRNDGGWSFTCIDNGLRTSAAFQGVTEADFDNDGDLDLLICQGYEGNGGQNGPLRSCAYRRRLTNIAASAGLSGTAPGQQGPVFCDVNNDGWLDLHVQRNPSDSSCS
jgi:hypothetical protein